MAKSAGRTRNLGAAVAMCLTSAVAAAEPAVPSGPHPRLFMRPTDVTGYTANARTPGTAAKKLVDRCQRSIDRPDEVKDRGGVDGDYWPGTAVACAFAYRATGEGRYLTQALKFWRVSLNDDQTIGDGKGCTAEHAAVEWRTTWNAQPPAPPALVTVTHDTWYPIRWYGPYLALAYDWLYDVADEPLRLQTRRCLTGWIDGYTKFGYLRDQAGANYHAGFAIAKTLGAIAIGDDGGADGHLWTETLRDVFARDLVGKGLSDTSPSRQPGLLVGGDWGSWQYGPLSVLEYAVATRALEDHGAPQPEMAAWLGSVVVRAIHGMVPTMDRQFAGNGDYEGEGEYAVYKSLEAHPFDAALLGPTSDQVAGWALFERQKRKLGSGTVWNAIAELRTVAPADYRAQKPPLWYLARGVGNLYARTAWSADAFWAVFMSGTPKADHAHYTASNFVFSRGGDHLVVDSTNYGQFSTLGSNGIAADTSAPEGYARTQGPWGLATMPWVRGTGDGVFAARADFARAFEFNGRPSDIESARRDWVMLPEGEIVAIDRVATGAASRNMYVSFHANTAGSLALDAAGELATGKVGGSRLVIHRVRLSGGTPKVAALRKGDCPGDCRYPCGSCTAARFDVDVYTVAVPGPFAVAIHVLDGLGAAEAPAQVGSIDEAPIDPGKLNTEVIGAGVLRGGRQSYVVASSRSGAARLQSMRYGVPGETAARHVVFDAPEAKDGTSVVTAKADAGRCVVAIAAGQGGGATGRPLIFDVASASAGCAVGHATGMTGAAPLPAGYGETVIADVESPSRDGLRTWLGRLRAHARLVAFTGAVGLAAVVAAALWARRRLVRPKTK